MNVLLHCIMRCQSHSPGPFGYVVSRIGSEIATVSRQEKGPRRGEVLLVLDGFERVLGCAQSHGFRVLSQTLERCVLDLTHAGGGHSRSTSDRFCGARLSAGQAVTL